MEAQQKAELCVRFPGLTEDAVFEGEKDPAVVKSQTMC